MTKKKASSISVPSREAESVRKYLQQQHLLREDLKIRKEGAFVYLPVKETPRDLQRYSTAIKSFEVRTRKPRCYKDLLTLPKERMKELPSSFDIIGEIILIKLPKTLVPYKKPIGDALLQTHTNIRTVCLSDPVSGELRTRAITIIAGEKQTLTRHTEYGLSFNVNVKTTYFSPRLASERRRVASHVKPGEIVVDLFAGVAPFSIMIARFAQPNVVYAIDKNWEAIVLAQENVTQNHVLETVEIIHADAKDVKKLIPKKADRIIMNLPFSAYKFFSVALSISASNIKVHYYDILQEEQIEGRVSLLKKIAEEQDFRITGVVIHKIKSYAPREFYIGLDITATKTPT